MRRDFCKVVTESPRGGSGSRNKKTGLRISGKQYDPDIHDDLSSARQKMSMYSKDFSDVLGPIKGFLRKSIGRLWDDVYSEIRSVISSNASEPIRHIWEVHLKGEIAFNCFFGADGKIYHFAKFSRKGEEEVSGFYIHPETRRLEFVQPKPKLRPPKPQFIGKGFLVLKEDKETGEYWEYGKRFIAKIDDLTRVEKRKGIWFLAFYHRLTEEERVVRDLFGRIVRTLPPLTLVSEKQASKKELKKLGLKNDRPRF